MLADVLELRADHFAESRKGYWGVFDRRGAFFEVRLVFACFGLDRTAEHDVFVPCNVESSTTGSIGKGGTVVGRFKLQTVRVGAGVGQIKLRAVSGSSHEGMFCSVASRHGRPSEIDACIGQFVQITYRATHGAALLFQIFCMAFRLLDHTWAERGAKRNNFGQVRACRVASCISSGFCA